RYGSLVASCWLRWSGAHRWPGVARWGALVAPAPHHRTPVARRVPANQQPAGRTPGAPPRGWRPVTWFGSYHVFRRFVVISRTFVWRGAADGRPTRVICAVTCLGLEFALATLPMVGRRVGEDGI